MFFLAVRLYLIEILHQTTTCGWRRLLTSGCILSKFYIKPQQDSRRFLPFYRCILSKFYIKPQLRVIFNGEVNGCILSKFYIKPQLIRGSIRRSSVVSYRNSTSNHNKEGGQLFGSGVVSYRNSTSNHNGKGWLNRYDAVVSYRNSTSNHNKESNIAPAFMVVSYRNSTSNHNVEPRRVAVCVLYLIEILHQTTTITSRACSPRSCILSKFYIKPQPKGSHKRARYGCILSKFYIKPQLKALPQDNKTVVSYRNSTSNHNKVRRRINQPLVVSYRNSTSNHNYPRNICLGIGVVSYRNSTSNHNTARAESRILQLYLIEILHQTTTSPSPICACCMLYLIEILHQTTTHRK